MRILLVDDDEGFADMLMQVLAKQNYLVDLATDGQMGWEFAEAFTYDLILLDVTLPKLDGISLCKRIRTRQNSPPILFLTTQDFKVTGLDAGADDYMVKPCNLEELLARIRALLRRAHDEFLTAIAWGNLCLNPNNCEVTYDGQLLHLTAKEYALLELFLRNRTRIFSQNALLEKLWSLEASPSASTIRGHIKSLRQKLKQAGAANNLNDLIETVHGLGYRLKARESDREDRMREQNDTASLTPPAGVELGMIWQRSKPKYLDRVQVLECAVAALHRHELSAELQQQALHEAHTLIGALGSFGFDLAADLARQIEQLLQPEVLSQPQIASLDRAIAQLGKLLMTCEISQSQSMSRSEPLSISENDEILAQPLAIDAIDAISNAVQRSSLPTANLLIVDDEPQVLEILEAILQPLGFKLTLLEDPQQFWQVLEQSTPDLIILDVNMPVVSGIDLCRTIRQDSRWGNIPILFLSAHVDCSTRQWVFEAGADDYMAKPIVASELIARVLNCLKR